MSIKICIINEGFQIKIKGILFLQSTLKILEEMIQGKMEWHSVEHGTEIGYAHIKAV